MKGDVMAIDLEKIEVPQKIAIPIRTSRIQHILKHFGNNIRFDSYTIADLAFLTP